MKDQKNKLRLTTFLPPFIILSLFVALSIINQETFLTLVNNINNWIISNLGWAASILALAIVVVGVAAMFTKFGDVRIGGENAKPELSNFAWFTIALTTTMAAGVLFWGPAEPIAHYMSPPTELTGIEPMTNEAMKFSMETMFLHWTIVPYAIYTVPAVVFGFMYYNAKRPFSIASEMAPVLGKYSTRPLTMKIIDAITLFSIGAGMAGSVAQGFLNISGGVSNILGIPSEPSLWLIVAIVTGIAVVFTSISGIQKAMKHVSNINVYGYIVFLVFLLVFSNAPFLLNLATEAMGGFIDGFFDKILLTGASADSQWPQWWTTFYWFSWMAWAPTSGAFMGRIAYGRKVKHVLGLYIGVCAAVSAIWMTLVSGTALWTQKSGAADLVASYNSGVENVPYDMLESMPFSDVVIILFVILIFLSLVTACNSNTIAMAGISTHGISPDNPDAPNWLKFVWGFIAMALGFIMIATIGVDGVKIIANFGGMFAALIMIGAVASLGILIKNYKKYDLTAQETQPPAVEPAESPKEE